MSTRTPVEQLNRIMRGFPNAQKLVNEFLVDREGLGGWPEWCFLPMAGWYTIVCDAAGVEMLTPDLAQRVGVVSALGTWRYSQGIYRFDADLRQALVSTPVSGKLPTDVLYRLPEWCIYIEHEGSYLEDLKYLGFWVHLEHDMHTQQSELRILLNLENGELMTIPVHIGDWSIEEAIERAQMFAYSQLAHHGGADVLVDSPHLAALFAQGAADLAPIVNLVLYVCADEPEIDDSREPGVSPSKAGQKRTKKGMRIFPVNKSRVWSIGTSIGEKLRDAANTVSAETPGTSKRAHIRRGHWHSFWTGPRDGDRTLIMKWIPPLIAGGRHEQQ